MSEEPATPGHTPSVRELLGLPPDADEATVAKARARLLAILLEDEPPAVVEEEQPPAVAEEIADADGAVDPLAELGEADVNRRPTRPAKPRTGSRAAARRSAKKWAPIITVAAVLGVVLGAQLIGGSRTPIIEPTAQPTMSADSPGPVLTDAPTPVIRLDEAAIAEQEALLEDDPDNPEIMRTLADLHFDGNDFAGAAEWGDRLVAVAPDDAEAHLMLGVAHFNQVELPEAQAAWETVVELDPANAIAYYNLGFLYWSLDPPNVESAKAAWERVLELEPDSDMAANVGPHLNMLQGEM